jgi:uncharacterized membrane protein
MMPLLGESMRSSMKPMFVMLPMFLIVYYVLVPMIPFRAPATPKNIQQFFFIVVFISGIVSAIVPHDIRQAADQEGGKGTGGGARQQADK